MTADPIDWFGPDDDPAVRIAGMTGLPVRDVQKALSRLADARHRAMVAVKVAAKAPGSAAHVQ